MNYLSVIYEEHLKKNYCIGIFAIGGCSTCGCNEIRTRLFDSIVKELKINPEETGTREYFRGLGNVKNTKLLQQMIENLCQSLNLLDEVETRKIGNIPYNSDTPRSMHNSILVFIILEIWNSLRLIYKENQREDALKYLLELTKNDVVFRLIESMDRHFKSHHFRKDPSENQFWEPDYSF